MPTFKNKRGTTTTSAAYTGPAGEIVIDTTLKTIRVQDGATAGGILLAKKSDLDNVATAASDAQTAANNAQTTANSAQTTATDAATNANGRVSLTADDTKTGRLRISKNWEGGLGNLHLRGNSPNITYYDTDGGQKWLNHVEGNNWFVYKSATNSESATDWVEKFRVASDGNYYSPLVGWASEFFRAHANCGGGNNAINCYGGGDLHDGYHDELMDDGATVRIRTVQRLRNCNCNCNCK